MPHRAVAQHGLALAVAALSGTGLAPCLFAQDTARVAAESLSLLQRTAFERGEAVQLVEPVPGLPWPRVRVFRFVDATPAQSAAVMSDYEYQPAYQPTLRSARVVSRPSARDAVVHFVIAIPVLSDEEYDMWQGLSCAGGEYTLRWRAVGGDSTAPARVSGSARFAPWENARTGAAGTVLVYEQLVVPGSWLARLGFIRKRGIQASRDAADNLARQIERERTADVGRLEAQLRQLRSALGGGAADSSSTSAGGTSCPAT